LVLLSHKSFESLEAEKMSPNYSSIGARCAKGFQAVGDAPPQFYFIALALLVFIATTWISATAANLGGLLGRISPSHAIFLLSVLSKLGDWVFDLALASTVGLIKWYLLEASGGNGVPIMSFLALDESSGLWDVCRILVTKVTTVSFGPRLWALLRYAPNWEILQPCLSS
jgi:hypothetical protein